MKEIKENVFICTWNDFCGTGGSFESAFINLQEVSDEKLDYKEVSFYEATNEVRVKMNFVIINE